MVDWNRLVKAVLCTTTLLGVCIIIALLPNKVLLALVVMIFVCALTFAFYKAIGEVSDKDNE